jgi:Tfp pilus assembly protein PilE
MKSLKLKASTILEVIIAMVIILVVFVLATQIYVNVISSSPSLSRQAGIGLAESMVKKAIAENDFTSGDLQQDSMQIRKVVTPYKNFDDLYQINIVTRTNGKVMGDYNYIYKKDDQ